MSVLVSRRGVAKTQFIQTAIDIEVDVIEILSHLSTRYQRVFLEKVSGLAIDIVNCCESGNNYFPNCAEHIQKRKELFEEAVAKINALDVQLALVYEVLLQNPQGAFTKSDGKTIPASEATERLESIAVRLGTNLDTEIGLVKGVIDSDKKRVY